MGVIENIGRVGEAAKEGFAACTRVRQHAPCEIVDARHAERPGLERFIADIFRDRYGASIKYFHQTLMGVRGADGQWMAAAGLSPMLGREAFLDVYLDTPAEALIETSISEHRPTRTVARDGLVEVGNLAATRPGGARLLILELTRYLHRQGFEWVVITATGEISNSLTRLGYAPRTLCEADPRRLPDQGLSWGSYYSCKPHVMAVDIAASYAVMTHADQS